MRQGDREAVAELLGRTPQGAFEVVVRDGAGSPVVILNSPLLEDGTPMPTRYWLVGRAERESVSRLESGGGVRAAEAAVDAAELAAAHARYEALRDAALPRGHTGPRPAGGVGGRAGASSAFTPISPGISPAERTRSAGGPATSSG